MPMKTKAQVVAELAGKGHIDLAQQVVNDQATAESKSSGWLAMRKEYFALLTKFQDANLERAKKAHKSAFAWLDKYWLKLDELTHKQGYMVLNQFLGANQMNRDPKMEKQLGEMREQALKMANPA
jgi:hypothetical protein